MKRIDKIIHWKLLEISIMISVILVSFPLWKYLEIDEVMTTAAFYDDARYTYLSVEETEQGPMFPLKNEDALRELKPSKLRLINETKTQEEYTIALKVNKTSSLDYHCLNIAFDQKVEKLEDLYFSDDADYFYFVLKTDTIRGEIKEHNFLIWMDASTGNEMMNKTLSYSFEIQKGILI